MSVTTVPYTMRGKQGAAYEVEGAVQVAPGLVVFRLPGDLDLNNPARWNIGHHSGYIVAEAMTREFAMAGAKAVAPLYDWTRGVDSLIEEIDEDKVLATLGKRHCGVVHSHGYERGDVSRNGTYTDADIEQAAREAKADGMSAFDVLYAMSHTVPWMGLDTNDFNEAHDRIATAAGAE
ncbi:hypothetical protein ABZ916_39465 [Streptomyces sp. NPDC046853]|uniref:hypothetical protein n=1 Tax=Streptomyces sp. NPDC046853 TaxID=3154920 RepID=UPI0033DC426C